MNLAENIRSRREALGMTQAVLALRSGVSRQSIVSLESTGECRLSSLRRIAATLRMQLTLEPEDLPRREKGSIARERSLDLPVPGERPNIRQLMNQARIRQEQRAQRARADGKAAERQEDGEHAGEGG